MAYEWVTYQKEDGIAIITLNRPDRMNSFIPPMRVEVRKCIEDAAADNNVRVLIVTGAGRGFCAGADVGTFIARTETADDEPAREHLMQSVATVRLVEALRNLNKPTIAAVNGVAAGSGTAFALACDVIIASDQARFRVAFTRMGIVPGDGATWLITEAIGTHRALEPCYTRRYGDGASRSGEPNCAPRRDDEGSQGDSKEDDADTTTHSCLNQESDIPRCQHAHLGRTDHF